MSQAILDASRSSVDTAAVSAEAVKPAVDAPLFQMPSPGPAKRKLKSRRAGYRQDLVIDGQRIHLSTGEFESGEIAEIFLTYSKEGTFGRHMLHAFAISVSMGLQRGIPLSEYVAQFKGTAFQPQGMVTDHPEITEASSVLDLLFRELENSYLRKRV